MEFMERTDEHPSYMVLPISVCSEQIYISTIFVSYLVIKPII